MLSVGRFSARKWEFGTSKLDYGRKSMSSYCEVGDHRVDNTGYIVRIDGSPPYYPVKCCTWCAEGIMRKEREKSEINSDS